MTRGPEANINPELLIWARRTIGYSIEEAADKLGQGVERVNAWEAGALSPTVAQLRKIAEKYKRPLAVFFLPEPPQDFQALRDFRRVPGAEEGAWSVALREAIIRAHEQREAALDLADMLDAEPPPPPEVAVTEDAENVGLEIRRALGVSLKEQIVWGDPATALRGWLRATESTAVLVFQAQRIEVEEMRGFSISETPLPAIVLNGADSRRGRIFTLLHEYAHIVLHTSGVCDLYPRREVESDIDQIEVFCNQVAAATLLPRDDFLTDPIVERPPRNGIWEATDVTALANRYSVSREVVLRRLLTFDLTTFDYYIEKRAEFIEEYKEARKRRREERRPQIPYYRLKVRDLGRQYVELALDAYHSAYISTSEAADYLDVKVPGIDKIAHELALTSGAE